LVDQPNPHAIWAISRTVRADQAGPGLNRPDHRQPGGDLVGTPSAGLAASSFGNLAKKVRRLLDRSQ